LYEDLAKRVVVDSLNINSRDIVTIVTYPHTVDAANAIAIECFKQGADAMIQLWTDDYFYGFLENLSEDSLREESKICQVLTEMETASIGLGGPENPDRMKNVDSAKFSAWYEGERKSHYPRAVERKIRNANVQIGMVTQQRARVYGFNYGRWKKVMENALGADLKSISKAGRDIGAILHEGKTVQITSESGTNLKFELAGRKVHIDDGIVDNEDIANDSFDANLPAGSVFTTVDETSAEGKAVFDLTTQLHGSNIEGIEWVFKEGKVTSFTARKNLETITGTLEKATGDKDKISFLRIGLNPRAEYRYLMNSAVEGSVTIGIGDNEAIGGKNASSVGFEAAISDATVEIDGRTVVKNGKLVLESAQT
jgi:leucyl aminopeptidase (aminopeptidase T)